MVNRRVSCNKVPGYASKRAVLWFYGDTGGYLKFYLQVFGAAFRSDIFKAFAPFRQQFDAWFVSLIGRIARYAPSLSNMYARYK